MKLSDELEQRYYEKSNEVKSDLIGSIWNSDLIHYLELDRTESRGERTAWNEILRELEEKGIHDKMKTSQICDAVNVYGNAAEESGFRKGFHVAMKLCMEGMNGGVFR